MTAPPVFIVGSPRSGTSLLRQMLNRHPSLAICYETQFLRLMLHRGRREAFGDLSDRGNRERVVREYITLRPTLRLGVDCARLAERLLEEATSYPAFFTSVMRYYAETQGKHRFGDKTPAHCMYVEMLCEWFPAAPVLHIVRDPRDVVSSLQRMPFGSSSAVVNARTWLRFNLAARRIRHRPEYLQVRYETLVAEPARELTRICKFIGEEYSPLMLTPEQPQALHPDAWDRYQSPLTTTRLERWRKELTPAQVAQVEWIAGQDLDTFGYTRESHPPSWLGKLTGVGFAVLAAVRRLAPRIPALWYRIFAPHQVAKYEYWTRRRAWVNFEEMPKSRIR